MREADGEVPEDGTSVAARPVVEPATAPGPRTFIVRLVPDLTGAARGIVEAVRTGRKERFEGTDAIGPAIARLLMRHAAEDGGPAQ